MLLVLLGWSGGGCSAWKDEVTYYVTWWHYGDLALRNVVLLDKPWRGAQSTQLCKLSWAEKVMWEVIWGAGILVWLRSKGEDVKI